MRAVEYLAVLCILMWIVRFVLNLKMGFRILMLKLQPARAKATVLDVL
jgi:hypothetical protein